MELRLLISQFLKGEIVLNYQCEPSVITGSFNVEEGGSLGIQSHTTLLPLKREEGDCKLRKGSNSWERQGNGFSPTASRK